MTTRTYLVKGMTCSRCEQPVTGELSRLNAMVRAAVDEAGYQLDSWRELPPASPRRGLDVA